MAHYDKRIVDYAFVVLADIMGARLTLGGPKLMAQIEVYIIGHCR
jgi:hypothetical protein